MKNFKLFGLMLLAGTLIFSSCKKDEETTTAVPTIAFSNGNDALVYDGTNAIDVTIDVTAEAKVKDFTLVKIVNDANGSTETPITINYDFDGDASGSYRFQRSSAEIGIDISTSTDDPKKVEYKFSLTDKDGTVKNSIYTVTMAVASGNPIHTYSATLMGAQDNANAGSFFASTNGSVYLTADANNNSSLIDIIYYYGSTNEATLCAPNDVTVNGGSGNLSLATGLTTQNATTFATTTITATQFDAMTDDMGFDAITAFPETKLTTLTADKVIAFKTAAGKIGLLKVSTITTGTNGSMEVDVKVQQ